MGTQMVGSNILAFIENEVMPLHEVLNAIRMVKNEAVEKINPLIIEHASSLNSLQMDSSSVDFIISMCTSEDFPGDNLVGEFSRVLKPGGEIFIHQSFDAAKKNTTSSLGRKLSVAGFSNIEVVQMAEVLSEGLQSFGVKGRKPSWKVLPKVVVVNEMDVIDEDSLLSEEDLKKSQLPTIGDCEVGSKRKTLQCGSGDSLRNNVGLENVSRVNSSQPPHSLQFETIRFPTKTSQNQFLASQPQSPDNHDTPVSVSVPVPYPSRRVKRSKRKSFEKVTNPDRKMSILTKTWLMDEEMTLINAWIDISEEDTATGLPTVGHFWKRVLKHFHNAMGRGDYVTESQLSSKWRAINAKVVKFNDIYNKLLNERGSGQSEADILEAAFRRYNFQWESFDRYMFAWDALKESQKWVNMYVKDHTTSGNKRTKTSHSNDYTTSLDACCHVGFDNDDDTCVPVPSQPVKSSEKTANHGCTGPSNGQECTTAEEAALASAWVDILEEDGSTGNVETVDLNDTDDEIEPEDDDIESEEPQSPIGRDKGNRASSSTLSGSGMDEKIDRLVDKLDKFTSTYGQLEKEKIRIKEKAWEEKIRAQNEAREAEDFKILTANIDHLMGPTLRAALALKEKIAKRYGFE
ncbi:unnamed protein product [Lactuca virosa]|uniref:Anamorsin N-terminal domain-containing protein n=1 Tax=Lactuca virosa TaxID=75947 RepID=A0AAU9PU10_9ASTR|nr:unnamed protein product [Lactuca virosa]